MKKAHWGWVLVLVVVLVGCGRPGKMTDLDDAAPVAGWYSLKIGQKMDVGKWDQIMRVPGGWAYTHFTSYGVAACFIPYSEEGR